MNDWRLLRQYIEAKSDTAFSQIVDRHIKMVYWTCRRDLADPQQAEDATQEVFLLLVRKAHSLYPNVSIAGWLFNTARLVCRNFARAEIRRKKSEQEAMQTMETATLSPNGPGTDWTGIEPRLNDALAALSAGDRDIVLLRYFDGFSLREIAQSSGISEDAAGKRANRAVEKLKKRLEAGGAGVSTSALASLLSVNSAPDIPSGCRESVISAAHSLLQSQPDASAGHSLTNLMHKGVYVAMQMSKGKVAALAAAAI